jgi:hypothetical protein
LTLRLAKNYKLIETLDEWMNKVINKFSEEIEKASAQNLDNNFITVLIDSLVSTGQK